MTQAQLCGKILTGSRDKIIKSAKKYKKKHNAYSIWFHIHCYFVVLFPFFHICWVQKNVAHKHLKSLEKPKKKTRIGW